MAGKLTIDQKLALRKAELRAMANAPARSSPLQANGLVLGAALLGASRSAFLRRVLFQLVAGPPRNR